MNSHHHVFCFISSFPAKGQPDKIEIMSIFQEIHCGSPVLSRFAGWDSGWGLGR